MKRIIGIGKGSKIGSNIDNKVYYPNSFLTRYCRFQNIVA